MGGRRSSTSKITIITAVSRHRGDASIKLKPRLSEGNTIGLLSSGVDGVRVPCKTQVDCAKEGRLDLAQLETR